MSFLPLLSSKRIWAWALALALSAGPLLAADKPPWDPKVEEKIGKQAGAEVDKYYDRVDNKEVLAKLQGMADAIAANTPRPDVKYDVRLVKEKEPGETPEVNAFSLPGGIVYVTEGLVNVVHSDHELAGVMAHEITHNVHYDALNQAKRAEKIFKGELWAILATVLIGGIDNEAWGQVMQAGMLYRHSVLGGYSLKMEKAADLGAVQFLLGTPWDPVGLLTFMERLAAEERRRPPPTMGAFQTHPLSYERVSYLIDALERSGVYINRRKTARWSKPTVEERQVNGKAAQVVVFQEQQVFACDTPAGEAKDPKERAGKVATALTQALANGAQSYTFCAEERGGTPVLLAYGKVILSVTDADAALVGEPAMQVVKDAQQALSEGLVREGIVRLYGS